MKKLKKFVNDHREVAIGMSYGALIGGLASLYIVHKHQMNGMESVSGRIFNTDDGHSVIQVNFANGTRQYLKSTEQLTVS
jgi:hypothetical protein